MTLKMRRTLIQVFGFLISTLGWLFVSCTTAMDYWRIIYVGGKGGNWMIMASWYWSNLWRDCVTDTSSVTNCRDYDVLWSVTPYVQGVRGLLIIAISLGFVAFILCFIGMDCTYIGGSEKSKDKTLLSGAVFHFVGGEQSYLSLLSSLSAIVCLNINTGLSACAGYCLYTNRVASTAFSPSTDRSVIRYAIGTPIFLGLVGSFFIILGSVLYAVTIIPKRMTNTFRQRPSSARSVRRTAIKTHYTRDLSQWSGSHISRTSHANDEKLSVRDTFV